MVLVLSPLLISLFIPAQGPGGSYEQEHRWHGSTVGQQHGTSVAFAGDVNADGHEDILVGSPFSEVAGQPLLGTVILYSGADGSIMQRWDGFAAGDRFGSSVAGIGDQDGDGVRDVVIGAPGTAPGGIAFAGTVFILSGSDGSLIRQIDGTEYQHQIGHIFASCGDINGDGFEDLLVGVPIAEVSGIGWSGSVFAYSGMDGTLLRQWDGVADQGRFGSAVAGGRDLDGDGTSDIVIGASWASSSGALHEGAVSVFSGQTGHLLQHWTGEKFADRFGKSVALTEDLDGDGTPDVLVGAPYADPAGVPAAGSAYAFSGATGLLIHRWDGIGFQDNLGSIVSGAGDFDNDGTPDILATAPTSSTQGFVANGAIFLYSGLDGSTIHHMEGDRDQQRLGQYVDGAGDVTPNDYSDLLIGDPLYSGHVNAAGTAYVFGFNPYLSASSSEVSASNPALVALEFDFSESMASAEYRLLISASDAGSFHHGVDIPLVLDGRVLRTMFGDYYSLLHSGLSGHLNQEGRSSGSIGIMPGTMAPFIGRTFHMAAIANWGGELPSASSIALPITIVP